MTDVTTELPQAESADPDGVQVALRAAHTLWSNGETAESLRWLRRAAETASDEGADIRSLQLAKAAAELRAKLSRKGIISDGVSPSTTSSIPPPSFPASSSFPSSGEAPLSERVVTATQYPSQRPPRSLMGISSATLERVMQRDSSAPAARVGEDGKLPPEPPPLPLADAQGFAPEDFASQGAPSQISPSQGALAGASWAGPKDELSGAALDPRTWSSELAEPDSVAPRTSSSARPPPMPRGSYGPPPLPALEDEEIDSDPEFLSDRQTELSGYESRPVSHAAPHISSPHLSPMHPADEFAPDDWRLPPREPTNNGLFGFAASSADPAQRSAYPASAPPPSSVERSFDNGFGALLQSALDPRPGAGDSERPNAGPQPLSARVHHQAVRVALAPDPRSPGQFILRALREREAPHSGERVALLVALEPGTPLV
jgi:hypothetical protein